MNAWSQRAEIALLLGVALVRGVHAQDGVAPVREAFDRGRLDEALLRTEAITDASLREQWRFHVLYAGGDLSSALETALAAVREHPHDKELLGNAAIVATALGQGVLADDLCRRWRAEVEAQPLEPGQLEALLRRVEEVGSQAREAASIDASAQRALVGARGAALTLLALCCAALVVLARWGRMPRVR